MRRKNYKETPALSPKMIEVLMDCHERELLKQQPCTYPTQYAKGLLNRGLMVSDFYDNSLTGKKHLAFFITSLGKDYLEKNCCSSN